MAYDFARAIAVIAPELVSALAMAQADLARPIVYFASAAVSTTEGNSGTKTLTLTARRSTLIGTLNVPGTFVQGTAVAADFPGGLPGNKTWAFSAGSDTATVDIIINGDTDVEGDETFGYQLQTGSTYRLGSPSSVTGTILNDDSAAPPVSGIPREDRLLFHIRADDLAPQANDTEVTSITDRKGGLVCRALTNQSGGPRYIANAFNGKPALRFFRMGLTVDGFAGSVFEAATKAATGTLVYVMGNRFNGSGGSPGASYQGGFGDFWPVAGNGSGLGLNGATVVPDQDGFATLAFALNPSSFIRVNSGAVWQHYESLPFGGNFTIGGFANGYQAGMFGGDILEVLFWPDDLTQVEHIQLEKYMRDKYALPYPWAGNTHYHVFDGDSITRGQGVNDPTLNYPYRVAAQLGLKYGAWTNVAKGGWTWDQLEARAAADLDKVPALVAKPTYLYAFEWYNQSGASSATDTIAKARTYLTNRVAANFKTVFGTSTDFSVPNDANRRAARAAFDDYWDTAGNRSGLMTAYVRIHTDANIGVAGSAATDGNATYFEDGIHLKSGGYAKLANLFSGAGTVA